MTTTIEPQNGVALAMREQDIGDLAPRMVVSLAQLRENLNQLEQFKRDIMIEGVDYGVIPGTPKPTLLKPGAEKLAQAFGLSPIFEITSRIEDWERGFFHYEIRCDLISKRSGRTVASAHGSANSKEPRYRWRDAKPSCPDCGMELRRSKRREGDPNESGWYCWAKAGGCGATWPKETVKVVGRVENPEPYELVNTVLKMAEKRALVADILIATGGSGTWTQDIEDMPSVVGDRAVDASFTTVEEAPRQPAQQKPAAQPRQAAAERKPSASMVTDPDDIMWQRWLELKSIAEGLGVVVPPTDLPIGRQLLQSTGMKVRDEVVKRQAEADKKPAEPAPPMVTTKDHPLWLKWLEVEEAARKLGLPADTSVIMLPISEEALKAATEQLASDVDNAESIPF